MDITLVGHLEGSLLDNLLPMPDIEVPGAVENLDEFPYAVLEGVNYWSESAEVSHTAVFGSESSTSDATSISERQQSDPTVEERIEAIRKVVEDGKLDDSDTRYLKIALQNLSVSDRFILLERFDAAVADGTFRTDFEVAKDFWEKQDFDYNCGTAVPKMILDKIGIPTSEGILTLRALIDGSLTSKGMDILRVGEILERHGVAVDRMPYVTVAELEAKLSAGHGVIVAVDADELWKGQDDDAEDGGLKPNHVVWLLEIDRSDPDNPVAVMNDSGHPEGAERRVPLHIFMDAFEDSEGFAVVTKEPLDELRRHFELLR